MLLIRSPATPNAITVTVTPGLLDDQAGLAVDRALQNRDVGCPGGDFDVGARDLLAAVDRVERGPDRAAAVGDRDGVGVEDADETGDVYGLPCRLEVPDNAGPQRRRSLGGLRRSKATAGRWGQLATSCGGSADLAVTLEELIRVADDGLAMAKRSGRNRVVAVRPAPSASPPSTRTLPPREQPSSGGAVPPDGGSRVPSGRAARGRPSGSP